MQVMESVLMQRLQRCSARCKRSPHNAFSKKAHGNENVVTHCQFCHPLCFTEELQAQNTPTSHGSFHSSVLGESLWMGVGVVLATAVNAVVVIRTCHLFCCFLRQSHERQLFTPPVESKNEIYSTMKPWVILWTLEWPFFPFKTTVEH